ncbi:MAG TPA: molecular chaperone HtpG, partial [Oscillospiraceae bacterium]|nr:molecular chaperone HtpG [Oscillospiraceae bacterium]
VSVTSKAYGEDKAYRWQSEGTEGYTLEESEKDSTGTDIVLKIKDNTDDDRYDEFLEQFRLKTIIKKYSDYIRYPIRMDVEHQRLKDGTENEYDTIIENETLNSMIPIWRKNKNELTEDDYNNFYIEKFYDYQAPARYIHTKTEGVSTYDALLYIPSKAPFDYFTKDFQKGLQLYSNGVLIMDKCADLLPDHFGFVKGLVDSADLSLNISREMLQHDRQLKLIARSLEKTIKNELLKMLKNDREKYEEFFKSFGITMKYGIYNDFGANKEQLKDLILFRSSFEEKPVTLEEYVSRIKEDQKYIYYAAGESIERIKQLPQTELVLDKGYEILYLTDDVDEFSIRMLEKYNDKEFKSVSAGDLELNSEDEKKEAEKQTEENRDMFSFMQESLKDYVKQVCVSKRLKTHPVCLSSDGMLSLEMEKVLNNMPSGQKVSAEKVLEINPNHAILDKLKSLYETDKDKLKDYSKLLYTQALLIEGMPIENPVEFTNAVCELMVEK